jgi:hypothetical protein
MLIQLNIIALYMYTMLLMKYLAQNPYFSLSGFNSCFESTFRET